MTLDAESQPSFADATLIAALFAVDPSGLGGVVLRGPPSPVRDGWLAMLRGLMDPSAPFRRLPPNIGDDRLLGGLDLAASLATGKAITMRGLLADCNGGVVVVPLAERIEIGHAARLADILDNGEIHLERDGVASRWPARIGIVALDEGLSPDERPPAALLDRLAFEIDLTTDSGLSSSRSGWDAGAIAHARCLLGHPEEADETIIEAMCTVAYSLGIQSLRAPTLAIRTARVIAALQGRSWLESADAAVAARLVLGSRATTLLNHAAPAPKLETDNLPSQARPDESAGENEPADHISNFADTELAIAAIRAALPDKLLDRVVFKNQNRRSSSGRGGNNAHNRTARRGRPLGSRAGAPGSGAQLSLIDTLRAAAPWQNP